MSEPRRIGDYELLEELGAGGMGTVYRARHLQTGVEYALKTLRHGADPEFLARFQREGEGQARVDAHPNVVRVHTLGQERGAAYLVMDLAPGGSLHDRLADGLPPPAVAAGWVRDLALAVEHAHRQGVLHRDLKPHNVLFTGDRPQLTDFGLAKLLDADSLTETGTVLGTPAYMAPEQVHGDTRAIGPATDVYGLGALLYRCLTGRPPFKGGAVMATMSQVLNTEPTPPRALRPEVSPALEAVCLDALAKDPALRPPSAQALALALEAALATEPRSRSRAPLLAAVGLAVVGALSLVVWSLPPAPTRATDTRGPAAAAADPSGDPTPTVTLSREDLARRDRPCPGLHAEDVKRAAKWATRDKLDEASVLLHHILSGAPCQSQVPALLLLGDYYALPPTGAADRVPRDLDLALRLYRLAALTGDAQACHRLGSLWLPEDVREGIQSVAIATAPADPARASAALWLASEREADRYRADWLEYQLRLPPWPRDADAALAQIMGPDGHPVELPREPPSAPDPIWLGANDEGLAATLYQEFDALQANADLATLRPLFLDMLECGPSYLNATFHRHWASWELREGSDDAHALQLTARAILRGDDEAAETLAFQFLPLGDQGDERRIPDLEPDPQLAKAALRLAYERRRPQKRSTVLHLMRAASIELDDLPNAEAAYRQIWLRFPDAR